MTNVNTNNIKIIKEKIQQLTNKGMYGQAMKVINDFGIEAKNNIMYSSNDLLDTLLCWKAGGDAGECCGECCGEDDCCSGICAIPCTCIVCGSLCFGVKWGKNCTNWYLETTIFGFFDALSCCTEEICCKCL